MRQEYSNTSLELMNQSSTINKPEDFNPQTERDYTSGYVLILIALVIIVGNCLVLLTVKSFKKRLVADIFISCLSLSDLTNTLTSAVLAILFKFTLLHKSTDEKNRSVFRYLCQTQGWFTVTTQLQSVFIVTLITLERFVAVNRPFLYKAYVNPSIAFRILAAFFLISVLISTAPLLGWDNYVTLPKLALCMFPYAGSYAILIVVIGYVDILLVSYCFLAIRVSLKKFMKRQSYFARRRGAIAGTQMEKEETAPASNMTRSGTKTMEQSKRLLKVCAIVSFLFYFSWLPLMIGITYAQITNRTNHIFSYVASLMPLTSPLINPLIYFISWERYKRSYINIVKRLKNCWPHRHKRSMEAKDLTKVPGVNSPVRSIVRNSGLPGRLELMACGDDCGDLCSENISSSRSLVIPKSSFNEYTDVSYSANALNRINRKYSQTSAKLRRHSMDHVAKNYRSFSSTSLSGKGSVRKEVRKRRHTIGEFSDAVRSSERRHSIDHVAKNFRPYPMSEFWQMDSSGKSSVQNKVRKRCHTIDEFLENAVRSSKCCKSGAYGRTSEPQYEAEYIIRSDAVINGTSKKCKTVRKALPPKELENELEFYLGETSMEDFKLKEHMESKPWYTIPRKSSSGEGCDHEISDAVSVSYGHEKSAQDSKRITKGLKKRSKLEACCNDVDFDFSIHSHGIDTIYDYEKSHIQSDFERIAKPGTNDSGYTTHSHNTDNIRVSGKSCDVEIGNAVSVKKCTQSDFKTIRKDFEKGSSGGGDTTHSHHTRITEGNNHGDIQTFSASDNCPITKRIQEYLTRVEDEEKENSLKKSQVTLCEEDI